MVLTAVDENTPVAVEVLPGQVHEAMQVEKMLDASQARLPRIEEAVADKGFDGEPQRQAMASRNIRPVIPYRVNRRNRGRLNRKAYAERNKIERLIGKLKEFRRIATRYDKLKETFLGIIQLALAYICLKAKLIVNKPSLYKDPRSGIYVIQFFDLQGVRRTLRGAFGTSRERSTYCGTLITCWRPGVRAYRSRQ
jgi:transposase